MRFIFVLVLFYASHQLTVYVSGYQVSSTGFGSFDWDILSNNIFEVAISEQPVLEETRGNEGSQQAQSSVVVYSKHGQKHVCSLPSLSAKEDSSEPQPQVQSVQDLLEPLMDTCYQKTVDWWTYEYCHGKHIRQYHLQGGHITGEVINIGFFDNESDWSDVDLEKAKKREGLTHDVNYSEGTTCDLTNKPRKATAKISCSFSGNGLERVAEPEPCVYMITVRSSQLCLHPLFAGNSKHNRAKITCSPVVNEEEFLQYQEAWERREKITEGVDDEADLAELEEPYSPANSYVGQQVEQAMGSVVDKIADALSVAAQEAKEAADEEDVSWLSTDNKDSEEAKEKFRETLEKLKSSLEKTFKREMDEEVNEELDVPTEEEDESASTSIPTEQAKLTPVQIDDDNRDSHSEEVDVSDNTDPSEEVDEARHFDVGGWKVRVASLQKGVTSEEEEDESLKELQNKVSKELEEKLEEMGVNANGKVKVRFVTNQDFDGEDENDVNKVMRSLPEDTNQLVSNYLKDVFSGGKLSKREKEKHSQLEDNYNKVWSPESEKGEEKSSEHAEDR